MAVTSAEAKLRKRRFAPKARTGCQTCKIRRVKCDEERPTCQKCVSTGRTCDGYDPVRVAQPKNQKDGSLVFKWVQPSNNPPGTTGREHVAFHTFHRNLLGDMAAPFDATCNLWNSQVLPLSRAEPAVWNAVVALGFLGAPHSKANAEECASLALQHYSKAMKALQDKIAGPTTVPQNLALLVCLLFVTFEFQQRAYGQAHSHLNGGLNIIREYEGSSALSQSPGKDVMDPIIEAFERLDVQMASFTSSEVYLKRTDRTTCATKTSRFECVSGAMRALNFHMGAMRDLDCAVQKQIFSPEGLSSKDYVEFQSHIIHQLTLLHGWELAVEGLRERFRFTSPKILTALKILEMRQIYCKLKISSLLSDGRELLWDSYIPDFEHLIELAEAVVSTNAHPRFTLDTGILPPVYFTVLKCRDPRLRRRALEVLRKCKHQEGAWDGPTTASTAERVVKLEEQGIRSVSTAADVPEEKRLYQAYYDLRYSDKLVYCKRRRFESDGSWVDYTAALP